MTTPVDSCVTLACENGGYQDRSCNCQCPFGFTGTLCETLDTTGQNAALGL